MARAVLIAGSNEGDSSMLIARAGVLIERMCGKIESRSALYESAPWGEVLPAAGEHAPGNFLNRVFVIVTSMEPEALLDATQDIECTLGRKRMDMGDGVFRGKKVYKSRTMDVDILFYDDLICESDRLVIPHPLIGEREFVLRPLAEAAPLWKHPVSGLTASEMLENIALKAK